MSNMRCFRLLMQKPLLCFGLVFLIACGRDITRQRLSDIESYIDSRPDSALAAIRQIDTAALRGRAVKAKYSLLHAIALDKNYIDTADTRIVQPAVDWYDRHGSPEERLKAYMYLGTEQYNAGRYNQAIVSFSKAAEFAESVEDQNLLGILYSRMADTFTMTMDYRLAESFIGKALNCFRDCGRGDQERWLLLSEAKNKAQLLRWDEADSCFLALMNSSNVDNGFKRNVEIDYAMFLLSSPNSNDSVAVEFLENYCDHILLQKNLNRIGALAYSFYKTGEKEKSDSIMRIVQSAEGDNKLYSTYWKHRMLKSEGDYKRAYYQLWESQRVHDSLSVKAQSESAAKAQKEFQEQLAQNNILRNKIKEFALVGCILLSLLAVLFSYLFHKISDKRKAEELENMNLILGSLENQILSLNNEKRLFEKRIETLSREKTKAKFAYLAELFEILYNNDDALNEDNLRNTYYAIKKKVLVLKNDEKTHRLFEESLNKESNNIIQRFRDDFPLMPEESIRLASFIFAGYDNATLALLLGETATNTRTLKNRLLRQISSSASSNKDEYLSYFPRKN